MLYVDDLHRMLLRVNICRYSVLTSHVQIDSAHWNICMHSVFFSCNGMYLCTFVLALMLKDIAHYAPCCIKKAFWVKICIKTLQTPRFSGNRAHATSRTTNSHVTSTYARAHACALPLLSARRTSQELWLVLSCRKNVLFVCFLVCFLSIQTVTVWKCLKENWLAPHEWACNHGGSLRRVCTACSR